MTLFFFLYRIENKSLSLWLILSNFNFIYNSTNIQEIERKKNRVHIRSEI